MYMRLIILYRKYTSISVFLLVENPARHLILESDSDSLPDFNSETDREMEKQMIAKLYKSDEDFLGLELVLNEKV